MTASPWRVFLVVIAVEVCILSERVPHWSITNFAAMCVTRVLLSFGLKDWPSEGRSDGDR